MYYHIFHPFSKCHTHFYKHWLCPCHYSCWYLPLCINPFFLYVKFSLLNKALTKWPRPFWLPISILPTMSYIPTAVYNGSCEVYRAFFLYVHTRFLYYTIGILRFNVTYFLQQLWGKSSIDSSPTFTTVTCDIWTCFQYPTNDH